VLVCYAASVGDVGCHWTICENDCDLRIVPSVKRLPFSNKSYLLNAELSRPTRRRSFRLSLWPFCHVGRSSRMEP
jgi:hypothetical protein